MQRVPVATTAPGRLRLPPPVAAGETSDRRPGRVNRVWPPRPGSATPVPAPTGHRRHAAGESPARDRGEPATRLQREGRTPPESQSPPACRRLQADNHSRELSKPATAHRCRGPWTTIRRVCRESVLPAKLRLLNGLGPADDRAVRCRSRVGRCSRKPGASNSRPVACGRPVRAGSVCENQGNAW